VGSDPTGEIAQALPEAEYEDESTRLAAELAAQEMPTQEEATAEEKPSEAPESTNDEKATPDTGQEEIGPESPGNDEEIPSESAPETEKPSAPAQWPKLPEKKGALCGVITDLCIDYADHLPKALRDQMAELNKESSDMTVAQLKKAITETRAMISEQLPPESEQTEMM